MPEKMIETILLNNNKSSNIDKTTSVFKVGKVLATVLYILTLPKIMTIERLREQFYGISTLIKVGGFGDRLCF